MSYYTLFLGPRLPESDFPSRALAPDRPIAMAAMLMATSVFLAKPRMNRKVIDTRQIMKALLERSCFTTELPYKMIQS